MKTIAFHTFGCKLNFAESSTIARSFLQGEYEMVNFKTKADIYIIHSCMVTLNAEKKCIAAIKNARKLNAKSTIAVIGCMPELNKKKLQDLGLVDYFAGNNDKYNLKDIIENNSSIIKSVSESFISSYSIDDRTRAFIKIQDGCDYFCSYCTIPLARGRSRSDNINNIVEIAKNISSKGVKEIVLTGVNIGDFGRNNNESFYSLLNEIEDKVNIDRVRFSSIEPNLITDDIIKLVSKSKKILPHFHIPLQSGSENVLKLMSRRYNKQLFAEKVELINKLIPDSCIATDIIAGFPGETNDDFLEECDFIETLNISYMHVFTYSQRNNTKAANIIDKIPEAIKKERSAILHQLSDKKKKIFYDKNIGNCKKVLFESKNNNGLMYGFTENYVKVQTKFNKEFINKIVDVELTNYTNNMIFNCQLTNH